MNDFEWLFDMDGNPIPSDNVDDRDSGESLSLIEPMVKQTIAQSLHTKHVNDVSINILGQIQYDATSRVFTFSDGSKAKQIYIGSSRVWYARIES